MWRSSGWASVGSTPSTFAEYHNLQGAFGRRALIEQAKGILMACHAIGADQAFEMLRHHSQHNGCKLVDVAEAIVEKPPPPAAIADPKGRRSRRSPCDTAALDSSACRSTSALPMFIPYRMAPPSSSQSCRPVDPASPLSASSIRVACLDACSSSVRERLYAPYAVIASRSCRRRPGK
jgi:ANTAR domain